MQSLDTPTTPTLDEWRQILEDCPPELRDGLLAALTNYSQNQGFSPTIEPANQPGETPNE